MDGILERIGRGADATLIAAVLDALRAGRDVPDDRRYCWAVSNGLAT